MVRFTETASHWPRPAPRCNDDQSRRPSRTVPCFRWLPGMSIIRYAGGNDRIMDYSEAKLPNLDGYPDLSDPATIGCLLHLVREAWGDHNWAAYEVEPAGWVCVRDEAASPAECMFVGDSEAEALVAALEAAP